MNVNKVVKILMSICNNSASFNTIPVDILKTVIIISVNYNGQMKDGNTINICNVDCTKFLGHIIGVSSTIAQKTA